MSEHRPMPQAHTHHIHRHAAAPWVELRTSVNTFDCYRAHAHAEYCIGIVDQGHATFLHPEGPSTIAPGAVVLIEPQVVHACNPLPSQVWSYRMLFINAAWLHQAVAPLWHMDTPPKGLSFLSRCLNDPGTRHVVHRLCQPVDGEQAAQALAQALPAWVAGLSRPGRPRCDAPPPAELAPAFAALHTAQDQRLSIRELAAACSLSESRFIRRFRQAMGMTPGHYLQNLRLNGARRLLSQGAALADAAHAMGFADQAHLQRAFKAHHAMTPGAYRNVDLPAGRKGHA